jgi:hypothetical protein
VIVELVERDKGEDFPIEKYEFTPDETYPTFQKIHADICFTWFKLTLQHDPKKSYFIITDTQEFEMK